MVKILEKVERRLGEKLFLKGDRCIGPKCAAVRRGYVPGAHGKSRRKRRGSEYADLLKEKQKLRFFYGLDDTALQRYTQTAVGKGATFSTVLYQLIERRLDNVVYLLSFAASRRMARQIVSHGHVMVNGKTVTVPSFMVSIGNVIALKPKVAKLGISTDLDMRLKKGESPQWLSRDAVRREAKVIAFPDVSELQAKFDASRIKEFYSR